MSQITEFRELKIDFLSEKLEQKAPIVHYHPTFELAFFLKADVEIFVNRMKYNLRDGDLMLINPYDIHRIFYHRDCHYTRYVIYFDKTMIEPLLQAVGRSELLTLFERNPYRKLSMDLKQRTRFEHWCKELLAELKTPEPDFSLIQLKLGYLLVHMGRIMSRQKQVYRHRRRDERIRQLIDYLEEHCRLPIRLDELADMSGLNKYYLSHTFKAETGFTIIEYVNTRKVIESQKLLLGSDKPIVDIGFECGFQSVQHFGRVFKSVTAMTPGQYRRAMQS